MIKIFERSIIIGNRFYQYLWLIGPLQWFRSLLTGLDKESSSVPTLVLLFFYLWVLLAIGVHRVTSSIGEDIFDLQVDYYS